MNSLFRDALRKADEVRMDLELDMFDPINIFDTCLSLGLNVYFTDINMEGTYVQHESGEGGNIILSSLRPLPRRCFTCAHELGHNKFRHGTKIDTVSNEIPQTVSKEMEEMLVDSFAGALLMPIGGIEVEFVKRKWKMSNADPIQFYTVSSVFGTGYRTLVVHCKINRLITDDQAFALFKWTPKKIFKSFLQPVTNLSYFKIIDTYSNLPTIDIEVSNYLVFSEEVKVEGMHLNKLGQTKIGIVYEAVKPGIVRISSQDEITSSFVRIQKFQYTGHAQYRHLES